jgi:phosphate-selective porin OprO/OprP
MTTMLVSTAVAQTKKKDRRGLIWDDRPSIVFAKNVTLDLRVKVQLDERVFDPDQGEDSYDPHTRRLGISGKLTKHFEYEVTHDATKNGDWKDVYLHWQTFDAFSVQGGRFKIPFGLEELTSISDIDFVFRSLASTQLAPARDKGVMVHGRFFGRGLTYQVGVFNGDGDNGRLREEQFPGRTGEAPGLGHSVAGRITAAVLRPLVAAESPLRSLRVGAGYTTTDVPEGLNSLRGEAVYGYDYFPPVYVKGRRQRVGVDLDWTPGPVGIKAEWIQVREDRNEQGLGNVDLSDLVSTGYYASGTWLLTGEDKDDNINPRHPLFRGGIGGLEVGARYDVLGFGSASTSGAAFRNPRAAHILGNEDRVWTIGVNWYPVKLVKVVANAIHESLDDAPRTPVPGTKDFWSGVVRFQLAF